MQPVIPDQLAWYYADEQPVRDLWWHPAAGDQVIDVGCYMGNYSVPALAAGASVIAVDPDTAHTAILQDVAQANGFTERLAICNVALFDGTPYPDGLSAAIATSPWNYHAIPPKTPFTTVDALVADGGLERLDWIKIDAEGSEAGVLRGAMKALERFHPALLIEDHSIPYPWVAEQQITRQCTELLASLGYTVSMWKFDEPRTFMIAR